MRLSEITLPEMNGGINTRDPVYNIADNQSPDMLNIWYRNKALCKRDGQALTVEHADVYRISKPYNGFYAVHAGGSLYKWGNDGTWLEIKMGIAQLAGVFVEFGDTLFYMDGTEIWQINSDYTVHAVEPYMPVVMINCKPDLSESSDNESYNLIGAGFCVHYHGDGSSKEFQLPLDKLDGTEVEVVVDAVDKKEGTDFDVDRPNGKVVFKDTVLPPGSGFNNVWITAYSTESGSKEKITGCTVALPFGGESSGVDGGSRVFLTGNKNHPLCYWRSDLGAHQSHGMRYFPDTNEEWLDQNSEPITAAAKMAGEMIIFKTHSIFAVGYAFDGMDVYYPVRECHSAVGCDMPGSIQLIDNRLVFANSADGVHMLISTSNKLEETVKPLSANINTLLLEEQRLTDARSCDFERYYWLCVGDKVFLWDYEGTPYYNYADYEKAQRRLAWYRFDGIAANDFLADGQLFYASQKGIVKFIKNKNDFGNAFKAHYVSKAFDLGKPNLLKTFVEVYPSFRGDGNVKTTVTVGNEKTDTYMKRDVDIKSFSWEEFNWSAFTWHLIKFTKTLVMKLRMKMVSYIQINVVGNHINRGFGLAGLRISYYMNRKVKR